MNQINIGQEYYLCQCPQSGFLHFYIKLKSDIFSSQWSVNALSRAFFISTDIDNKVGRYVKGVNALSRAFFISTHTNQIIT